MHLTSIHLTMPTLQGDVKAALKALEDRLLDVEIRFISMHTSPTEPASAYALDVQSYAVLSHAAFEEFAESLCLRMLEEIDDRWVNHSQFSHATLCLLHFDIDSVSHSIDRWSDISRYYDYIKDEIHVRKGKLSKYALQDNHGVGIKYLHSLFLPVGLDLPQDVNEKNSLEQLVKMRGYFAHAHTATRPHAVIVASPQDAVDYVNDVLEYMNKMARKAMTMSYYLW